MAGYLSINEVGRLTGLASHTIRYYEKQFPQLLDVKRTRGGHRQYLPRHLEALKSIISLLKDQKLSIKSAREKLGEPEQSEICESVDCPAGNTASPDVAELNRALTQVLDRLDRLCLSNERRDALLQTLLTREKDGSSVELLDQISRCRNETRETMRMYESLMAIWKN